VGDDDHVAVVELGRGDDQRRQVVALPHLGQAPDRYHA
jgi:hypothetical protein